METADIENYLKMNSEQFLEFAINNVMRKELPD